MPALKPTTPRIYHRTGAPAVWFFADRPRKSFGGDTGGGDVGDLAGGVPAAVRSGGCTFAAGPRGLCLSCDGSTGYASTPSLPALCLSGSYSFSVRITPSVVQVGNVVWKSDFPASGYGLLVLADGSYSWQHQNSSVPSFDSLTAPAGSLATGVEAHIAVTYDGATVRLYQDAVLVNSAASGPITAGTHDLQIGRDDTFARYFSGLIDDLRMRNYCVSAAEVAREFAEPFWRLRPPPRKTWWTAQAATVCTFAGAGTAFGAAFLTPAAPPSAATVSGSVAPAFCGALAAAASPASSSLAAGANGAAYCSALITSVSAGAVSITAGSPAPAYAAELLTPAAPQSSSLAAGQTAATYLASLLSASASGGCAVTVDVTAGAFLGALLAPSAAPGASLLAGAATIAAAADRIGSAPPPNASLEIDSIAPAWTFVIIANPSGPDPFRGTVTRSGPDPRKGTAKRA